LLIAFTSYWDLPGTIEFASDIEKLREEILKNIESLKGKTIYSVTDSEIFLPNSDVDKIIKDSSYSETNKLYVSNLTPLTIVRAKYLESEKAIIIKVLMPGEKNGIVISRFYTGRWFPAIPQIGLLKETFFEKAVSGFLTEIPNRLSKQEIDAIKSRTIFKGMSDTALKYSKGRPKKINQWIAGGEQWIYENNFYVYLIRDKVVNWQRF